MTEADRTRDYDRDAYRPEDPDLEAYEYDEEESGVRMPLLLIFGLVAIALAVAAYFFGDNGGYKRGFADGQANAVRSIAGTTGTRDRPANPGGIPAPQERDVFRSMEGETTTGGETVVSREEPIVELPTPSGNSAPTVPRPGAGNTAPTRTAETSDSGSAVSIPRPGTSIPSPTRTEPATTVPSPSTSTAANQPSVPRPSAGARPNLSDEMIGPAPAGPSTSSAPASSPTGRYVVQVASLPSRTEVDQSWSRMQARFPDLLSSFSKDVELADLGDRGVYHRLRVGYFDSKTAANALCSSLKARGQDCLVRTR